MNCTALAALPITATVSPVRSWSSSQRAEWKIVPAEPVETGDVGRHRGAEHAERAHHHLGLDLLAGFDGQAPDRTVVVPARGLHLGAAT